jgi:hypothetical protein
MNATNETAIQNETGSSRLTNQVSTRLSQPWRLPRMPTSILPVTIARQAYQPIATPSAPKKTAGIIMVGSASVGGLFLLGVGPFGKNCFHGIQAVDNFLHALLGIKQPRQLDPIILNCDRRFAHATFSDPRNRDRLPTACVGGGRRVDLLTNRFRESQTGADPCAAKGSGRSQRLRRTYDGPAWA